MPTENQIPGSSQTLNEARGFMEHRKIQFQQALENPDATEYDRKRAAADYSYAQANYYVAEYWYFLSDIS